MKKRDLILVFGMILIAAVILVAGSAMRRDVRQTEENTVSSLDTDLYPANVRDAAGKYFAENQADAFLLIRSKQSASVPIPLNEDYSFTIRQQDGSENVIHVGMNSFYMESSNCDNQNCVEEGTVTLENMNSRILFNMILCLPHELSLEMLTPAEAEQTLLDMLLQQEQTVDNVYEAPEAEIK